MVKSASESKLTLLSAQKEFNLDSASAIGNGQHVVTPPVFALIGGFNLGEDMRGKAGRDRREE